MSYGMLEVAPETILGVTVGIHISLCVLHEILCSFCKDQRTALTLARHNGHLELSKLLEKYSRRGG